MHCDGQTDGYVLLDWVHDNNAILKPDGGRWLVVSKDTGATLGEGARPSEAIIAAANAAN